MEKSRVGLTVRVCDVCGTTLTWHQIQKKDDVCDDAACVKKLRTRKASASRTRRSQNRRLQNRKARTWKR